MVRINDYNKKKDVQLESVKELKTLSENELKGCIKHATYCLYNAKEQGNIEEQMKYEAFIGRVYITLSMKGVPIDKPVKDLADYKVDKKLIKQVKMAKSQKVRNEEFQENIQ